MSPEHEPQSLLGCFAAQKECREAIYKKMDAQHKETLEAIGELKTAAAFAKGQAACDVRNAESAVRASVKRDDEGASFWRHPITAMVVAAVLTAAVIGLLKIIPW